MPTPMPRPAFAPEDKPERFVWDVVEGAPLLDVLDCWGANVEYKDELLVNEDREAVDAEDRMLAVLGSLNETVSTAVGTEAVMASVVVGVYPGTSENDVGFTSEKYTVESPMMVGRDNIGCKLFGPAKAITESSRHSCGGFGWIESSFEGG
jgi:hypothetical protein